MPHRAPALLFFSPLSTHRTQAMLHLDLDDHRPNKVKSGYHPISTAQPAASPIGRGRCNANQAPRFLSPPSLVFSSGPAQNKQPLPPKFRFWARVRNDDLAADGARRDSALQALQTCESGENGAPEQPNKLFSCMQGWRTPVSIRQSVRASVTRGLAALVD